MSASWRDDPPLERAPVEDPGYGYVLPDGSHPCSREELVDWIRAYPDTPGVWTPETGGVVRPEEVGFLVEGYRARRTEEAQQRLGLASLAVLALAGGAVLLQPGSLAEVSPGALLMGVLAVFWLLDSLYGLFRAGRLGPGAFPQQRQNERHAGWVYARPAPWTRVVAGALGLVFLAEVFLAEGFQVERAVQAAGVVKEAVWRGEGWRLLTGPMLHGGPLHLGMNLVALLAVGRLTEAHASRYRLALVFLASALAGSVFTLLLGARPSVGASGGVLGLVGFLGVRARRRPAEFPDDFLHRVRYAIAAVAVLGVLGFAFVDSWGHLGGLLAGAALGWLPPEGDESAGSALTGRASLALVLLACAWAAARLLGVAPAG